MPIYDIYVEIKGQETEKDLYKYKSIDNLVVIRKKEINQIKKNKFDLSNILHIVL